MGLRERETTPAFSAGAAPLTCSSVESVRERRLQPIAEAPAIVTMEDCRHVLEKEVTDGA